MVSAIGSQMQLWAIYWHLRTLSDQPLVISGIGLARFLPVMILSLFAGVVADHFNRRIVDDCHPDRLDLCGDRPGGVDISG